MLIVATAVMSLAVVTVDEQEPAQDLEAPTRVLNEWTEAFEASEIERMLACYEKGEGVTIIHSTGDVDTGSDAIREIYEAGFEEVVFEEVELHDLTMHRQGDVAWAVCRYKANIRVRGDGSKLTLEIRTSFVLSRGADDKWRIAFEHSSPLQDLPRLRPRD